MLKLGVMLASIASAAAGAPSAPAPEARLLMVQFYGQPDDAEALPPPPGVDPADWDNPPPRPARVCQKMCANDYSPCDPIYFKTEDARCDGVHFGR